MQLDACNHSEWAEPYPFTPIRLFSGHPHDANGSGTEQTLGLPLYLLNYNPPEATESPNHGGEIPDGHDGAVRAGSIPVEQLKEEILWPQQRIDASEHDQRQQSLMHHDTWQPTSTGTQPSSKSQCYPAKGANGITQPSVDPTSQKRKRGRPRLYATPTCEQPSELWTNIALGSRKSQLEKNRIAAEKSRRRKKNHTSRLTSNASTLSIRNGSLKAEEVTLREELLNLKNEVLRHAGCNSSIIEGYIARTAGLKLGEVAPKHSPSRKDSARFTSPEECNKIVGNLVAGQGSRALSGFVGPNSHAAMAENDLFKFMNDFLDPEG